MGFLVRMIFFVSLLFGFRLAYGGELFETSSNLIQEGPVILKTAVTKEGQTRAGGFPNSHPLCSGLYS